MRGEGDAICTRVCGEGNEGFGAVRIPLVDVNSLSYASMKRLGGRRTILIQPSQELEQKVSLATRFQCTAKTSRLCSCHDWTGNSSRAISKSLMEPSPAATTS